MTPSVFAIALGAALTCLPGRVPAGSVPAQPGVPGAVPVASDFHARRGAPNAVPAASDLHAGPGAPDADAAPAAPDSGWTPARPDYPWAFPRDHWAHRSYRTEWWYLTGHLASADDPDRRFGYQFTLFRVGLLPNRPALDSDWTARDLVMGHAAVTDLASGRHVMGELLFREIPLLGGFLPFPGSAAPASLPARIAWCRAPAGTDTTWTLDWNGRGFDLSMADSSAGIAFSLSTRAEKPLVFEGPDGYSRKGPSADDASEYYSFTRLRSQGSLRVDGSRFRVTGESWMDHEFGSARLGPGQAGWDWFGLQLDDGREIMLYVLRGRSPEEDFSSGTVVNRSGQASYRDRGAWKARALGHWKSPESGATYPDSWDVHLAMPAAAGTGTAAPDSVSIDLVVKPELGDQEDRSRLVHGLCYWEGMVAVENPQGERIGQGYVELTGYGGNDRSGR